MVPTHRSDVATLVGSALTSGNRIAVNGDGLKGQLCLAAEEATERYGSVAEDIQNPLLPDSS